MVVITSVPDQPTSTLHAYLGYRDAPAADVGLYLAVAGPEDVHEAYASAVAAGAESVWAPEQSEWNYRARVVDPQGVEWTLGTYRPGEPGAW